MKANNELTLESSKQPDAWESICSGIIYGEKKHQTSLIFIIWYSCLGSVHRSKPEIGISSIQGHSYLFSFINEITIQVNFRKGAASIIGLPSGDDDWP